MVAILFILFIDVSLLPSSSNRLHVRESGAPIFNPTVLLGLTPSFVRGSVRTQELLTKCREPPLCYRVPHILHEPEDEAQVMYRCQARPQHLAGLEEMPQVRGGVVPAGIAVAGLIQWQVLVGILAVGDVDPTRGA